MNRTKAKEQLKQFMGDNEMLTFTIKVLPGDKWVAQCNEIDSIITCGEGFDAATMENTMQDAIITAARIPKEYSEGLLRLPTFGEGRRPPTPKTQRLCA